MKYDSEICEAMHQEAIEMHKIGAITESRMREYDEMCLADPEAKKESASVYENSLNVKPVSHATA